MAASLHVVDLFAHSRQLSAELDNLVLELCDLGFRTDGVRLAAPC
jgi:hypothetical protein